MTLIQTYIFHSSFIHFIAISPSLVQSNVLDANTAFVSITLFNLLRVPFNLLPMTINRAAQGSL